MKEKRDNLATGTNAVPRTATLHEIVGRNDVWPRTWLAPKAPGNDFKEVVLKRKEEVARLLHEGCGVIVPAQSVAEICQPL